MLVGVHHSVNITNLGSIFKVGTTLSLLLYCLNYGCQSEVETRLLIRFDGLNSRIGVLKRFMLLIHSLRAYCVLYNSTTAMCK